MICDGQTLVCLVSDFLSFHSLIPALQKAYYCVKVEKLYNATLNKGFREDSFCFFKSNVAVFRFTISRLVQIFPVFVFGTQFQNAAFRHLVGASKCD